MSNRFWPSAAEFRMASGAKVIGRTGDSFQLSVSIPADEDGFLGRQCPSCEQVFRVDTADYDALPNGTELWCVYCGHRERASNFITQQQLRRARRAAADVGRQIVDKALRDALGGLGRTRSGSSRSMVSIRVEVRSRPFYPQPLPAINEEKLVRCRTCAACSLRYAVFGEHRFCPVCGPLPAMVVALDALGAETARLDGLRQLPPETFASLREQGVFTRLWVDTLENLVGVVETLGSAVFRSAVADASIRLKGRSNIFQRLDDAAVLFVDAGYPDLRTVVEAGRWERLIEFWATRHVFTHNDGLVDDKFLTKAPSSTARIGQRLTISEETCRQAITDTETLCRALAGLTTT